MRAQKLIFKLKQIPIRTFKDAEQRIIGNGNKIKGAIKDLEHRAHQIPRDALGIWKKFVDKIKNGLALDNKKAQALERILKTIPARTIKDAQQRIIGNGSKIKGVLRLLDYRTKQVPRDALRVWKSFVDKVYDKSCFDNLRAQKLKSHLINIQKRTSLSVFTFVVRTGFLSKYPAIMQRMMRLYEKSTHISAMWALRKWKFDHKKFRNRIVLRIAQNLKQNQRNSLLKMKDEVYKTKLISKLSGGATLQQFLIKQAKKLMKRRYKNWKDSEGNRDRQLLLKATQKYLDSLPLMDSMQLSFWRWK